MLTLAEVSKTGVGASLSSVLKPITMDKGTLISKDLAKTKRLLEDYFDFSVVSLAPDRLLARHKNSKSGGRSYWVLEIVQSQQIDHPQNMYNHWGVGVPTRDDVDRAYALAVAQKEELGIKRVQKPSINHGSYSFYIEDISNNWWEIEKRPEERAYATDVRDGDRFVPGEAK